MRHVLITQDRNVRLNLRNNKAFCVDGFEYSLITCFPDLAKAQKLSPVIAPPAVAVFSRDAGIS